MAQDTRIEPLRSGDDGRRRDLGPGEVRIYRGGLELKRRPYRLPELGSPAPLSALPTGALQQLTFNEPELQWLDVARAARATDAAMRKYDVVRVERRAPASAP